MHSVFTVVATMGKPHSTVWHVPICASLSVWLNSIKIKDSHLTT